MKLKNYAVTLSGKFWFTKFCLKRAWNEHFKGVWCFWKRFLLSINQNESYVLVFLSVNFISRKIHIYKLQVKWSQSIKFQNVLDNNVFWVKINVKSCSGKSTWRVIYLSTILFSFLPIFRIYWNLKRNAPEIAKPLTQLPY